MIDTTIEAHYLTLAEKWINGTITAQEVDEFSVWYNANQDKTILLPASFAGNEEMLRERMLENIRNQKTRQVGKTVVRRRFLVGVAAVLILLCAGGWYYLSRQAQNGLVTQHGASKQFQNDLPPGSDKAVLTLADGTAIVLDSAQNGALTQQGNTNLIVVDAGHLAYNQLQTKTNGEILYNTIATPNGGQYQVVLPDGTKVWLNAASSLRFPTTFTGKKRNVELTGEAYFEVAKKEAMPFNVRVHDMNMEVLGTHFNIMAYNDEQAVKTTLLEGAIRVTTGANSGVLKPGKMASFDKNTGSIKISDADVEEAVAWKNGLFQFTNENIKLIMRQVARWYDAEISFQGNMDNKHFTGQFQRNSGVSQVLKKLALTGGVHFTVEGKKIIVLL